MLRNVLCAAGAVLLAVAAWMLYSGRRSLFLVEVVIAGLVLTAGIGWERWRYKAVRGGTPDARWQDTGERFIDPESGALTAVYFDPASGERHYHAADRRPR